MLRIKEVAKAKGITLTEVAQKLGISKVSLSNSINGNPTLETLLKIAEVLDVDVRELITPTKDAKTLYIENNGTFTPIGSLTPDNLNDLPKTSSDEV
ncbi:helix-turn-helix transcriptional regulator [Bergeyella zoohelcum]|nr:helix-turn-helix transcriptional regulator [Bergeyella zoohelcum]MDY6024669.1 helix-turn-helix transcriptional regulator [Bergeyella zoohelcum]